MARFRIDTHLAPDYSELELVTRSCRVVLPTLLGVLAGCFAVGALFVSHGEVAERSALLPSLIGLAMSSGAAAAWSRWRPGQVANRVTGTRHGLMWGANGDEYVVSFEDLTSVVCRGAGLSRTLRFVSGKSHANTLEHCRDYPSLLQFVRANSSANITVNGQPFAEVPKVLDGGDDDAPSTMRSEELQIAAPPESQVRLRESEVEA